MSDLDSQEKTSPIKTVSADPHPGLGTWLFVLSLAVYLLTRLIRLPDFPIYFFTDEAIQTQQAADLLARGFRSAEGVLLPTYFENGGQYNLSLSVYAQVLPTLLLGKSVWVTRGVAALLTLIAAVSLGLTLKHVFHSRCWWLGPLLLAAVPAWFLHSRTAFETALMASMYAAFLYFYLLYRKQHLWGLYPALLFGALAFYAYSPGQVIVVVTGLMLLIADAKYHWQHRKTVLIGLGVLLLLAVPYLRFSLTQGQARIQHLVQLNSYWVKPLPLYEKILTYIARYLKGLNPLYWFWPNPSFLEKFWPGLDLPLWLFSNQADLARHTMKGYGHILWVTFPFWVIGLVRCFRRFKDPAHRTLVFAMLAAPSGAALVDWGITRGLVFIIPATLMTALGIEVSIQWLQNKLPKLKTTALAITIFVLLTGFSFFMLDDALVNGPTWTTDYGLEGMQYGSQQVFTRAAEIAREQPETTVLVSSTWANGSDVLQRFFAGDLPNLRMGNINAFALEYRPLDRNTLFVMTQEDVDFIDESDKFTDVTVEEILPYPDGSPGFYFLRLAYVDNIEAILDAEQEARQTLLREELTIDGQTVQVAYPMLDINEIQQAFDGDRTTLIRTFEANPLRLVLTFPEFIDLHRVTLIIGGTPTRMTVTALSAGETLETVVQEAGEATVVREIPLAFSQTLAVDQLEIEILNIFDAEIAHVHLWEVILE
jgi:hypothetical protein